MIDFSLPPDVVALREKVAAFIDDVVLPAEAQITSRPFMEIVKELQAKARAAGLWCPFVPKEYGGMGLSHLANAIVQVEVGRSFSHLGAWALNCMGPQDATMLTLSEYGTEEQKQKYLVPLAPTPPACRPQPFEMATHGYSTARNGSPRVPATPTSRC